MPSLAVRGRGLRPIGAIALAVAAASWVGCAPLPASAPRADGAQLGRCSVGASHDRHFVTEWPATERSRLEGKVASGLVVVSYSGCEMQVLDRCRAGGAYRYVATSVATDGFAITSDDELYAKLPLGAASLEGELARSGKLALRYAVVGQYEAGDADPARLALTGECSRATHVVTGYAVGAFALTSGTKESVGGGVSVPTIGVGAKRSQSEETVRSSGGLDACKPAAAGSGPPEGCRTPIQLFLAALPGRASASVSAQAAGAGAAGAGAAAEVLPSLRGILYLGGGVVGGGPIAASSAGAWAGPSGSGALGLRYRVTDDLEWQLRGSAGIVGDLAASRALIPLGLDTSLRIRPKSWSFYAGGGGGGSLTIIPSDVPYVLWRGLVETGFVLGATERWDVGVRGGAGSTFTKSLPALYDASFVVGYAFH